MKGIRPYVVTVTLVVAVGGDSFLAGGTPLLSCGHAPAIKKGGRLPSLILKTFVLFDNAVSDNAVNALDSFLGVGIRRGDVDNGIRIVAAALVLHVLNVAADNRQQL